MARRLIDAKRNYIATLTAEEARSLLEQGKIRRHGRKQYMLIEKVNPSLSADSACCLGLYDLKAAVGEVKLTEHEQERLIGWGILADQAGRFSSVIRAVHYPAPEEMETVEA